jgi:hypothetical protein
MSKLMGRSFLKMCLLVMTSVVTIWVTSNLAYEWVSMMMAMAYALLAVFLLLLNRVRWGLFFTLSALGVSVWFQEVVHKGKSNASVTIEHFDAHNFYRYPPSALSKYPAQALLFSEIPIASIDTLKPFLRREFPYYKYQTVVNQPTAFFSRKAFEGCDTLR